jgi:site-specific DNA-methyltransferase (adenine-specific)
MPVKKQKSPYLQEILVAPTNGKLFQIQEDILEPQIHYKTTGGSLYFGDSVTWLRSLPPESVDLIFADPPYNIKKVSWDRFRSLDHYIEWSREWISEASRILKRTGTLYICGFSEILADVKVASMPFFKSCRWLIWHYKNKANLGSGWGRSHESILHLRKSTDSTFNVDDVRIPYSHHTLKYPLHAQAETSQYGKNGNGKKRDLWSPHPRGAKAKDVFDIPTTCNGMNEKTPHPTQKPEELLRRIILASSKVDDLVLDPFSGAGTTAVVSEQLKRRWLACESQKEYNEWAIERLDTIIVKSIEEWIKYDAENIRRRESIR